jgi:uncharacterized Zn finger protein
VSEIQFHVQGSSADPYLVTFVRERDSLAAFCTCAAGSIGQYCKHRLALLTGDTSAVVSGNQADEETIRQWLKGSPLEAALEAVNAAERQLAEAKLLVTAAKKRLTEAFRG